MSLFHFCSGGNLAQSSRPPRALRQRSSKPFITLTAAFSIFTDIFLYGVIVPVIPFALQDRIGLPSNKVQSWTSILLAIYGGALLIACIFAGWLCDKLYLRKWFFVWAIAIQAAATLMLCCATSLSVLLIARVIQGLSGGVVWTVSQVILTDKVGYSDLGQALGWVALARTAGVILGPLLGGVLYETSGYYSVFGLSFAFLFVDGIFRLTFIEPRTARKWEEDISPVEPSLCERPYEERIENRSTEGRDNPLRRISSISRHSPTPKLKDRIHKRLPPLITLLGDVRLDIALWGSFLQALFLSGFDATLPIFVYRTFGWNSLDAGLIFLALVIPTLTSPIVGWLSDKHGPRWYTAVGYLLSTVPLVLLRLVDRNTIGQKILLGALLAIFGATGTLFEIPIWAEVIKCAELRVKARPHQYSADGAVGQAYGLLNIFYCVGVTVGPLLAGFIYDAAGWENMVLALGVLSFVSTIPTILCTGGYIWKKSELYNGDVPEVAEISS